MAGVAIAVDFGSSNTVVAWWNVAREAPESLRLLPVARPDPLSHLIPSHVFVRDARQGQVEIGQPAIDAGRFQRDPRHFARIKRYLTAGVGFEPVIDGVSLPPERVGQWFIHALLQHLARYQIIPSEICLTAPVQAGERYLRWLEACHAQALQYPKAPRVRTLDEPTAAALGYEAAAPGAVVLVVDFGGGTLDLSLVRLPRSRDTAQWGQFLDEGEIATDRQVELIAKTGQMLGGEDIDRWLLEDFAARLGCAPPQASEPLLRSLMERMRRPCYDPQPTIVWMSIAASATSSCLCMASNSIRNALPSGRSLAPCLYARPGRYGRVSVLLGSVRSRRLLEKERVLRTSRPPRCLNVLFSRSMHGVFPLDLLTGTCCSGGTISR